MTGLKNLPHNILFRAKENLSYLALKFPVLLAKAVEYVDFISTHNEYPVYDTKQFDSKAPVLELWRMWNISSLKLLSGSF